MSVEAGVLDGDHGQLEVVRDLVRSQPDASLPGEGGNLAAVSREEVGGQGKGVGLDPVELRRAQEACGSPAGSGTAHTTGDCSPHERGERTDEDAPPTRPAPEPGTGRAGALRSHP